MVGKLYFDSIDQALGCDTYVPEGMLRRNPANLGYLRSRSGLEEAMRRGVTLEAMCVMCDCGTMQLTLELCDGIRGIIPREECAYSPGGSDKIKDIAIITRVGKPVQFKIMAMHGDTALLSRRAAEEECMRHYVSRLRPGDIIPAKVTHLEPFGAFCDIGGGIVSLLTVDRVSVSRISHPSDRFRPGEYINAVVHSKEEDGRIYLTHRELLGTWEENAAQFAPGQTVTGIVRSVESYGVFVELTPNLAGLSEAFDKATPGDICSVYIKSMIPERMKIKLAMIDDCGRAEPMPIRYFIDSSVGHIRYWRYSPDASEKLIETRF